MGFPILALVGAGISATGSLFGGIAQGQAASYQAQVARNNAVIAQQNATHATEAGAAQAQAESLKERAQGGAIKAAEAAGNVDVNSGSASDVQQSQREIGELNTETVANNAALQAYGYRSQAVSDEAQAKLFDTEAVEAPIGGALGAGGSLLSNAGNIGFKWQAAQNNGIGTTDIGGFQ